MALISDPVSAVASVIKGIIDLFPTQEQKDAANLQLATLYMNGDLQKMTTAAGVITAEASSSSKLASGWRPILMLVFTGIIANNYIIAPYLQALFHISVVLPLPPEMWDLLKLGVSGYVLGRTAEKIATTVSGNGVASNVQTAVQNLFKGH